MVASPVLVAEYVTTAFAVTLGELIAAWVVHDLDHIGQIGRVLAKQFGEHVGPWRKYLPVLTRY